MDVLNCFIEGIYLISFETQDKCNYLLFIYCNYCILHIITLHKKLFIFKLYFKNVFVQNVFGKIGLIGN